MLMIEQYRPTRILENIVPDGVVSRFGCGRRVEIEEPFAGAGL
jgi:hypothetical protein